MYKQSLYKVIEPIKINTIKRLNRKKAWKYGYNKEHDLVVISKTGKIGEVYSIQNLKIALPQATDINKFKSDKWEVTPQPKALSRLKTIFDWKDIPKDFTNILIRKSLYFTRQVMQNKFFIPNNLLFPKSRVILENYYN